MYANEDKAKGADPLAVAVQWLKSRSEKEKLGMGIAAAVLALFLLWMVIEDHDMLFVFAEISHFVGIGLLAYKLVSKKTCVGISLQTQDLTMIFLAIRLYCSFVMEYDLHTVLDALTLVATGWVIYTMRLKLQHTYQAELDNIYSYYVVELPSQCAVLRVYVCAEAGPCLIVAVLIHPVTSHAWINKVLWAACVYIEAVSVLPQLRLMQKNKVVERFVGHYVFCLGLSRFFSCAHWILQVSPMHPHAATDFVLGQIMDGNSFLLNILGYGVWPVFVLLSEIVQTFILADFCYYYVRSYATGSGVVRLPDYVV